MSSSGRISLAIIAAAATVLTACGNSGNSAVTQVTIGAPNVTSGPDAPYGQSAVDGVKLAVKQYNAKSGIPVKVVVDVQDDQEKPEIGATLARKFCGDNSVVAVIGDLASTVVLSSQPVYNGCGLAQICSSCSNDTLTTHGYHNFFRGTARSSYQATAAGKYAATSVPNVKTVATIYANDATFSALGNGFADSAQANGLTVTKRVPVTTGAGDFRGALTSIIATKPDLLYLAMFFSDGGLVMKQARQLGFHGTFMGVDALIDPQLIAIAGAANVEGTILMNQSPPPPASFLDAFTKEYGHAPGTYSQDGYNAALIVLNAIQQVGASTDRQKIIDAMAKSDFDGTQGHIKFDQNGDLVSPPLGVDMIQGGKFVYLKTF